MPWKVYGFEIPWDQIHVSVKLIASCYLCSDCIVYYKMGIQTLKTEELPRRKSVEG